MSTPPDQPLVPPSSSEPTPAGPWSTPGPQQPAAPPWGDPSATGYPPASGYGGPPWPQQPAPAWGAPQPYAAADLSTEAALRKARTALGWAVGAAVGAFLAMLLAVGGLFATSGAPGDEYDYQPLRSRVDGLTAGAALEGARLERPLTALLNEVGSSDIDVSCPDVPQVQVSTSVVCTGDVDGSAWTGIVFFEDADGTFVVLEV